MSNILEQDAKDKQRYLIEQLLEIAKTIEDQKRDPSFLVPKVGIPEFIEFIKHNSEKT